MKKTLLASMVALACSNAYAIDPFTPLTDTANLGNTNEATNPFLLADGWKQSLVTDRETLGLKNAGGSWIDNPSNGFQAGFNNWDMIDISRDGRYVFIPMEADRAGVVRYDRLTDRSVTLMGSFAPQSSTDPGTWSATTDRYQAFDPAVLTPSNTLVVGEEWGQSNGRMFEVLNPFSAAGVDAPFAADVQWLSNIPSVSHEGIRFDGMGRMYFVDEDNSGSIYRMTPNALNDYTSGKVEVLSVDGFLGDPAARFDRDPNKLMTRTGLASWVEMVDENGNLNQILVDEGIDPFEFVAESQIPDGVRGGRAAADALGGTPYGRPEDAVIGKLGDEEILYFATTSENIVYGVNLNNGEVFEAINGEHTPDSIGNFPVGENGGDADYGFDDPDNLELTYGPNGELQLFAIEDENPGDIWMATDNNGDGRMDVIELFASLGPFGSEPTGLRVDPLTGGFLVNIQHPASGNDALWSLTPDSYIAPAAVPVPAAVWMFGSALLGLVGVARRKSA